MGNYVRTVLFAYMETICCELIVGIFAERKKPRSAWLSGIAYILLCCLNSAAVILLREDTFFKILFLCISLTLFLHMRYSITLGKCLLTVCGGMSVILACDLIFMTGWEQVVVWRWNGSTYREVYITLITAITKMVEFVLCAWLNARFSRDRSFGVLDRKGWFRFLIFSTFTIVAVFLLWADDGYNDSTVLTISFGLMVLNVLFYFTMWDIVRKERQNQEYRLLQEQSQSELKLYRSMETVYEEQRRRGHEYKNHLGCIQGLLEEQKAEEALRYLHSVRHSTEEGDSPVSTGSSVIDTVIHIKYCQAVREGITFVLDLDQLGDFPLEDEDAVILLSNLLDNALEACGKLEDPKERIVRLRLKRRGNRYLLTVNNRIAENVEPRNQLVATTKEDKREHGIGMRNIRDVLDKYHAERKITCDDGWFTYTIVL